MNPDAVVTYSATPYLVLLASLLPALVIFSLRESQVRTRVAINLAAALVKIGLVVSLIPTAVFSEPEIGVVGLTEEEAATHGDVDVYLARFRPMQNTLSTRTDRMVMKLITEKDEGKVLGVHIFGPGAGEMIQLVGVAMSMGATKKDLDRTIALHPTAAEELVTFKSPSYTYRDCKKVG